MHSITAVSHRSDLRVTTNDIAFHIQCKLQLSQGAELVSSLGYPHLSSNKVALRQWVIDHYEAYVGLERSELAEMMATDIHTQVSLYFGGYEINIYQ
ncbi:MAG: hypothetical protein Q9M19_02665 [Mariprofundaceae bacterium]|nr:hypothetical protein [Mariprofundaceae bacterium]